MFAYIVRGAAVAGLVAAAGCSAAPDDVGASTSASTNAVRPICTPEPTWYPGGATDRTPFLTTVETKEVADVQAMLDAGEDPNQATSDGRTALHLLARYSEEGPWLDRRVAIAELLLSRGAKIDALDQGKSTPLMTAAWSRSSRIAGVLLAHHADTTLRSPRGATALSYAVQQNNAVIVGQLLDAGSPLEGYEATNGNSPLHIAARYSLDPAIAKTLIERGAPLNLINCKGETPLHLATQYWYDDLVRSMLDHGADPNAKDDAGKTPLGNADDLAASWDARTHYQIIEALLASPRLRLDPNSEEAGGALVILSGLGRFATVKSLLDKGVPATARYKDLTPALAWSRGAPWDYTETEDINTYLAPIINVLATHGADMNAPDGEPLRNATAHGDLTRVRLLLNKGADPNRRKDGDAPALFLALRIDEGLQDGMVGALRGAGADINAKMANGLTVLSYPWVFSFGIGGNIPQHETNSYRWLIGDVSDETLFARVNGKSAVSLVLPERGPGGEIADEMRRRLSGKPTKQVCYTEIGSSFPYCWVEPADE